MPAEHGVCGSDERQRPRSPQSHIGEHLQQAPGHQKFSRYRSVRNANATPPQSREPLIASEDHAVQVKRSMSRYNKRRPTDPPGHMPPVPKLLAGNHPDQAATGDMHMASGPTSADTVYKNAAQEEAYKKLTGEAMGHKAQAVSPQRSVLKPASGEVLDVSRAKTESKRQVASRYRRDQNVGINARRAATDPIRPMEHAKFSSQDPPVEINTAQACSTRPQGGHESSTSICASPEQLHPSGQLKTTQQRLQVPVIAPATIHNTAAGIDAPVSAVNAGTRTVTVQLDDVRLQLGVDPTTTPADLLQQATAKLSKDLDFSRSLLAESFAQLGLERPLRHYEHIRDVMNSWDRDTQNTLQVMNGADILSEGIALRAEDAPHERPGDTSVHVHYSSKPGSWDKRWITLRSDGQVYVAKNAEARATEQRNICHMSDFDVYMPTARRLKKLRPPRKYCVAIKSLQKRALFESTGSYVHFFCVKEKELAQRWYQAAQQWRSWYLLHKMGLGGGVANIRIAPMRSASEPVREAFNLHGGNSIPSSRKLTKERPAGRLSIIQKPAPQAEPEPFAANGLLGRTYSQRQRQAQIAAQRAGPSVAWPGPMPSRQRSEGAEELPSAPESLGGALLRSRSTRAPGLAQHRVRPEYDMPLPRPGSGEESGGGLIEGARNVDPVLNRVLMVGPAEAQGGMLGQLGDSIRRSGTVKKVDEPLVDLEQDSAFMPGSLLAGVEKYQAEHEAPLDQGTVRLRNGRTLDTKVQHEILERVGEGLR